MDYESRLSKVEAQLEMNRKDIDRLYHAIDELRRLMLERFDRTDLSIRELREHTDTSINELRLYTNELRQYTDERFNELRHHTDCSLSELRQHGDTGLSDLRRQMEAGFAEVRREASVNMRWMMGMWLTTMGFIAGLGGRVFGMY